MKTIFFLPIILLFVGITTQAQDYYGDILPVYSLSDMNVKGKVKKITEKTAYLHANGKIDESEIQEELIYEFDETGNMTSVVYRNGKSTYGSSRISSYGYSNGKINMIIINGYITTLVTYSTNAIIYKIKDKLKTVYSISNGRITERKEYTTSEEEEEEEEEKSMWYVYEYNTDGKISKETTYDYDDFFGHITYSYDKSGNIFKEEKFDKNKTKESTTDYKYTYGKNNNWTKLIEEYYFPDEDKDDYNYMQRIRSYEYY